MAPDLLLFSEENLLKQITSVPYTLGYYKVRFYSSNGQPSAEKTDTVKDYYLYPSGGTLRDASFNIIFYSSKFDTYRGFIPPHLRDAT